MDSTQLLTKRDLAKVLKCSEPAIAVWVRQGMPCRRLGRLVRFEIAAVLAWHESRSASQAAR